METSDFRFENFATIRRKISLPFNPLNRFRTNFISRERILPSKTNQNVIPNRILVARNTREYDKTCTNTDTIEIPATNLTRPTRLMIVFARDALVVH